MSKRWPLSETAKVILDASAEALDAASAQYEQAQRRHRDRVIYAAALDGLPKIGQEEGEILGARRDGDEWVEIVKQ
jgi:hypothetical protein